MKKVLLILVAGLLLVSCATTRPVGDLMEGAEGTAADQKLSALIGTSEATIPKPDTIIYAVQDYDGSATSSGMTFPNASKLPQYKDGAADGDIQALNDTASVGSDGDPLVLIAAEVSGGVISNLGASGALYFLLPTPAIGYLASFNADVAQNIFAKPPSGTDIYWKAHDDTEFASGGADKDVQCNSSIAIGDRFSCMTRKVASTIEWFCWSDCDACIIEP